MPNEATSDEAALPPAPFVVGVARSGTTLLRLMLDAHPDLSIPPETHFLLKLSQYSANVDPVAEGLDRIITSHFAFVDMGISREELLALWNDLPERSLTEALRALYRHYAAQRGKSRWGDKTPVYTSLVGWLLSTFPEARIIHLVRDGRGVAASRRNLRFGPGPSIRAQALDWSRKIRVARAQGHGHPRYVEVRYEELVREPESVLEQLARVLRLEYDPRMLQYHQSTGHRLAEFRDWVDETGTVMSEATYRRDIHRMAARPPAPERIDHWREVLTAGEIAEFEAVAGDLLRELGYATTQ